jgi:hypothetical protein
MLEEMTGIGRETLCKILVDDLKKKRCVCSFCSSFVNCGSKTSVAASSVEFVEMIDDD